MKILYSIIIFAALVSLAAYSEQGTMNTDNSRASSAEASLSGTTDEEIDARIEEVQIIEEQEERLDPAEDVIDHKFEDQRLQELEGEMKD
jgi:Tfp pilus assembly protein PilN